MTETYEFDFLFFFLPFLVLRNENTPFTDTINRLLSLSEDY